MAMVNGPVYCVNCGARVPDGYPIRECPRGTLCHLTTGAFRAQDRREATARMRHAERCAAGG